jgi:hypothetical protein
MTKSPSVKLTELDMSSYAVTTSNTALAIVGYATKGPINEATLITSRNEFIEKFGTPPISAPWGHLAAYRGFNQGNRIIYKRVAETVGANQAVAAEKCINNASAASSGYQEFSENTPIAFGSYTAQEVYDFRFEVDNNGLTRDVYIVAPSSGDWTLSNIATQINTQITAATSGFQEWETQINPTVPALNTEYRFKVAIDGIDVASAKDLSVFLDPGNTLSTIATDIAASISAGSSGYQRWTSTAVMTDPNGIVPNLVPSQTYDFNVDVDGVGAVDVQITATVGMTWSQLKGAIQTAFDTAIPTAINAYCYHDTDNNGFLRFQSKAIGVSSIMLVVDDIIGGGGTPLFATIEGAPKAMEAAVAGEVGLGAGYTVAVNADTGRIRITSDSTGITSEIDITSASIGNKLNTLLTSILAPNDGEAAVAATCSVNGTSGLIRIISNATGSASDVTITEGTGADNEHLIALLGTETAVAGVDEIFESTTDNILFKALEKGSATNNISIVKSSRTNPVDNSIVHKIDIYYHEELKETFDNVSLDTTNEDFFVSQINADPANNGSEWIEIEYEANDGDTELAFADGTYALGTGTDEYTSGDTIGEYTHRIGTDGVPTSGGSALFVEAMSTDGDLANIEAYNFHIIITPDSGSETTQGAAITLCEYRKDCFYVADPPFGLTYNEVVDWHNGKGGHGRNTALTSSYSATYWPWLKDYNLNTKEYVWSPPSLFIAEKYMEIDRNFGPWYAVAGDSRGKILAYDYETSPSFAQREVLYGDFNAVNPIVNFATKGLEIYGQKTSLRENSALNRINVRRMVIYVKKLIKSAMEGIIFEPHNADSWARATNIINAILEPVRQANGLSNYRVTIDGSTNTPDVIAQSIMKGIIKLVPTGTIEVIDLTISIYSPGVTIEG